MKNLIEQIIRLKSFILLTLILPCLYGCGPGSLSSFLFGNVGSFASFSGSIGDLAGPVGGNEIATITNPEPASMLLMGSGIVAMSVFKLKNKKK